MIVCIAKLALSPHSPPTALYCGTIQGLAGQLLLSGKSPIYIQGSTIGYPVLGGVSHPAHILVLLIVLELNSGKRSPVHSETDR